MAAVPDQRLPHTDQHVARTADEPRRNGAQTEHLSRNGNQGSNGANMTPQNRNNGSSNGSENGSAGAIRPTHTFDPTAFDPGPDLPPLPTLRPLPTIRPLNRWPVDPAPVEPLPEFAPVPQMHPMPEAMTAEPSATVPAEPEPAPPVPEPSPPVVPAVARPAIQPVRHHRRASDVAEPAATPTPSPIPTPAPTMPGPAPVVTPLASTGRASTQRVLVLGGSGTIGHAVAKAMAAQGARVAVHHASHSAAADELVAALPGDGHLSVGADLADSEAVADLIRSVDEEFDGLDVVINAASAGESVSRSSVLGSSLADWTDAWTGTLTVDVLGAATVAHAAAAAFVARGKGGRIILLAAKGRPSSGVPNPVGVATEQAVGALGSVLASELAPHGIGVIVVGSGTGSSAGWSPAALAETVAWLASGPTAGLPGAVFNIAG